jgi:hypothetical protein
LLSQWKVIVLAGIVGAGWVLLILLVKPVYTQFVFALEDEKKVAVDGECPLVSQFNA